MIKIESKDNKSLKAFHKLKTKKGRDKTQTFLIDGLRIVQHALEKECVEAIIVTRAFLEQHTIDFKKIYVLDSKLMSSLSETETPQGIMAVVRKVEERLGSGKLLFLDQIQDPGNMGTLIRTADAAGFSGVLIRKGSTDPYGQKALRSSMGSVLSIPLRFVEDLSDYSEYSVYAATLRDAISYKAIQYPEKSILVIGNEGKGVSEEIIACSTQNIYIPMQGDVESLNASIAGGILMFHMT